MSKKLSVKPGNLTRPASIVAIVVAAGFLVFGLVLASVGFRENENEPVLRLLMLLFGLIWVAVCIGIIVINARLLARKGSAGTGSLFEIETEGDDRAGNNVGDDFDSRLRKLEGLRKDGLITEDEYRRKRGEIMGRKW